MIQTQVQVLLNTHFNDIGVRCFVIEGSSDWSCWGRHFDTWM